MPKMSDAAPRSKRPVWVWRWRSIDLGWLAAAVLLCTALVALIIGAVMLPSMYPAILVGLFWVGLSMFAFLALAVVLSGAGSVRMSRFVRPVDVAGVGRGLSVPERGGFFFRTILVLATALMAVSYVLWQDDEPGRRQAKAELATLVGAPACLLWFVLGYVFVNRIRISLHPEGIVQETYRRRARKVTREVLVVRWDDIVQLQPQGHPNPAVSHPQWYPTLRIEYRSTSSDSPSSDSPSSDHGVLVLMACEKKVEPNCLLALLQWCRDNPDAREQLADDDARELLRPPSLGDRLRADRAASISGRKDLVR